MLPTSLPQASEALSFLAAEATLPDELVEHLQSKTHDVCLLPDHAAQAMNAADDPDCSVNVFSRIIERDMTLATGVLTLANSALYCTGRPVSNLQQAVARLGFRRCRNLILATSLSSLMRRISLEEEWARSQLCHHGYVTGIVAAELNRYFATGFEGEDFTAGLVHDIGRTLIAMTWPKRFSEIDGLHFEEDAALIDQEQRQLGSDHTRIGTWFALQQELPESLAFAIAYHHAPERAPHHQVLVALVATADHIANHLQRFEQSAGYDCTLNEGLHQLEALGVDNATQRFFGDFAEIMDRSQKQAMEMD